MPGFTDFKQLNDELTFGELVRDHFQNGWPRVAKVSMSKGTITGLSCPLWSQETAAVGDKEAALPSEAWPAKFIFQDINATQAHSLE